MPGTFLEVYAVVGGAWWRKRHVEVDESTRHKAIAFEFNSLDFVTEIPPPTNHTHALILTTWSPPPWIALGVFLLITALEAYAVGGWVGGRTVLTKPI